MELLKEFQENFPFGKQGKKLLPKEPTPGYMPPGKLPR